MHLACLTAVIKVLGMGPPVVKATAREMGKHAHTNVDAELVIRDLVSMRGKKNKKNKKIGLPGRWSSRR